MENYHKNLTDHVKITAHVILDNSTNHSFSESGSENASSPCCKGSDLATIPEDVDHVLSNILSDAMLAVPEWEAVITGVVLSLITILTVSGNTLVVLSVLTFRPLRIVPNYFIVSLAVTDILVALLVFPFSIAESLVGRWTFGVTACQIWLCVNVLCCSASILHLCAIALDRYWAIKDPIAYSGKRTLTRVLVTICGLWCFSAALSSVFLLVNEKSYERFVARATCRLNSYSTDVVSAVIVLFYFTLCGITVMYSRIFVVMRRRFRYKTRNSVLNAATASMAVSYTRVTRPVPVDADRLNYPEGRDLESETGLDGGSPSFDPLQASHPPAGVCLTRETFSAEEIDGRSNRFRRGDEVPPTSAVLPLSHLETDEVNEVDYRPTDRLRVPSEESEGTSTATASMTTRAGVALRQFVDERQRMSLAKERRLAMTLGFIMGVFVACWLPFFTMHLVVQLCSSCGLSLKYTNFITWLGYINSTLNPVIYTVFNTEFRKAFKKLFRMSS